MILWLRLASKFAAADRTTYCPYTFELIPRCREIEVEFRCSMTSIIRGIDCRTVVMIVNIDAQNATAISKVDMINMLENFLPSKAVVALCGALALCERVYKVCN